METADRIKYTTSVFSMLITTKMDRLSRGVMLRQQMHEAITRGEKPTGYRAEWLRSAALEIIDALGNLAGEFDDTYLDDKCSVSDLTDVLATTMGILKSNAKKSGG